MRGLFRDGGPTRLGQVSDGLSHTAAFSERIVGDNDDRTLRYTDCINPNNVPVTASVTTAQLLQACQVPISTLSFNMSGGCNLQGWGTNSGPGWADGILRNTQYNHLQTPNSTYYDCTNSGTYPDGNNELAVVTARSYHKGGVNLLLGDGSVTFVGDSISLTVWQALATKDGQEPVTGF
jgi:prepilin-type processing-associated H-X9-DG protein